MKTIVITISRGAIAYNLLHNDFYRLLREKYKLVILTSAFKDERFLKEFSHKNVTFRDFGESNLTLLERAVFFLHKHLIYNSTVNQKSRWGIIGDPKSKKPWLLGHWLRRAVFIPLSGLVWLRYLVRWFDEKFLQRAEVLSYKKFLTEISADLVISTFVSGNSEAALIKAAKKSAIPVLGFPKSWDNLSKHGFRSKPDKLIVWNQFMKDQAIQFHNYRPSDVEIIGVPQYDSYTDKSLLLSRQDFCDIYDLDPAKKIILFGSEGKLFPTDTNIATILADYIANAEAQLLVRPHYGYREDEKKFSGLINLPGVKVDLLNNPSTSLRDAWDYSLPFAIRFINCLHHADVLINTASTLAIDAVVFDTPVICIGFDGEVELPYRQSVLRWYETFYYRNVLKYNAVSLVKSRSELISTTENYLVNSEYKSEERQKMREDLTYKLDGQAGVRFASIVEDTLNLSV